MKKKFLISFLILLFGVFGVIFPKQAVFASDSINIYFDVSVSGIDSELYDMLIDKPQNSIKKYELGQKIEFPEFSSVGLYYSCVWTCNGSQIDESNQVATKNVTYKIVWIAKEFRINYILSQDEIAQTLNYKASDTYSIEKIVYFYKPIRPNYYFVDWYQTSKFTEGTAKLFTSKFTIGEINLYPKWVPIEYEIDYHTDANNENNLSSYNVETETFELQPAYKKGHIFKGWFSDQNLSTPAYSIEKGSVGTLNFYPKWEKKSYLVTYEMPDGSYQSYHVEYGNDAPRPKVASKLFSVITFSKSTHNIQDNCEIEVEYLNIWYVYLIALVLICGVTCLIIWGCIKRRKKMHKLRMIYRSNQTNKKRKF